MAAVPPVSTSNFESFTPVATEELPEHLATLEEKHHEDINVRLLLVQLAMKTEEAKKSQIHVKNGELGKLKDKVETITSFVEHISQQLSNPHNKTVVLADKSQLVEKMSEIFPHDYLKRTTWTRDEAEKLCTVFTRRSDRIQNEINEHAVKINRLFEDWHELVPIWKEILKSANDLIDRINQRAGKA
ncbi:MAG TPA: hypothetical protein VHK67_03740 [Rhabdochlamydiaceae bacterium]|jgi:hypothetical protein|nr:hypothetical protein [Rhabdochlamydiaceae bacterium]